jgi:hypothetical protein
LQKTADFFTVKAKKAKEHTLTFVFLNRIIKLVVSVSTEEKILQRADLIIFIEKKN